VIIIGANDGSMPKDPEHISDVEIAQFIVALTRTRKQCHILSDKWYIAPMLKGAYQQPRERSCFLDWIPGELIDDRGLLSSGDI
jgi:superfamily I DNA/RNA helicase